MSQNNQGRVLSCEVCGITVPSAYQMQQHLAGRGHLRALSQRQTPVTRARLKVQCLDCFQIFFDVETLREHRRDFGHRNITVIESAFSCTGCGKNFHEQQSLDRHATTTGHVAHRAPSPEPEEESHQGETVCDLCNRDCRTEENLRLHLGGRMHRIAVEKQQSYCEVCQVNCGSLVSYNQHIRGARHSRLASASNQTRAEEPRDDAPPLATHPNGSGNFFCSECNLDLRNEHNFRVHMAGSRHKKQVLRPPPCELCNVAFGSVKDRDHHMKTAHKRNKARKAEEANEAFSNLEKMNYWLVNLGLDPQPSKSKARDELRKININIFDLVNEHYDRVFPSVNQLKIYTLKNEMVFPKDKAKSDNLQAFLRRLFH